MESHVFIHVTDPEFHSRMETHISSKKPGTIACVMAHTHACFEHQPLFFILNHHRMDFFSSLKLWNCCVEDNMGSVYQPVTQEVLANYLRKAG